MLKVKDRHRWSIEKSSWLSGLYYMKAIEPLEIVRVLNKANISYVLAGAHALGGWHMNPRTTEDVDLIIAKKHLKKAARSLLEAFPHLAAEDLPVVIRLRDRETQQVVIDLMKPLQTLYRETFKHTQTVKAGKLEYRIPCLEMALTMKFDAMLSPYRDENKKHYDAGDFISMVKANPELNEDLLLQLGELVYEGGGKGILEMVRKVRAGEKLVL
jgi:hypothetical protein